MKNLIRQMTVSVTPERLVERVEIGKTPDNQPLMVEIREPTQEEREKLINNSRAFDAKRKRTKHIIWARLGALRIIHMTYDLEGERVYGMGDVEMLLKQLDSCEWYRLLNEAAVRVWNGRKPGDEKDKPLWEIVEVVELLDAIASELTDYEHTDAAALVKAQADFLRPEDAQEQEEEEGNDAAT